MEILKQFCRNKEEGYGSNRISEPYSQGDHTYATNGWIAVRVPRVVDVPEREKTPDMTRLTWDHDELDDWTDLPAYDTANAEECRHCKGTGKQQVCYECDGAGELDLESDYNSYTVECRTCRGDGIAPGRAEHLDPCERCHGIGKDLVTPVAWGSGHLSMFLLEAIKGLPGVKLSQRREGEQPFRFVFDGGEGLVMPMRA